MINEDSIVQRKKEFVVTQLNGETVMMSIENGKYYCLNETSGRIWGLMNEAVKVTEIVDLLVDEYRIDKQTCLADILDMLNKFELEGMLEKEVK